MLVVAEEEALFAATLVAAHGVDARVLAAAVVELAFIHICRTVEVIATVTCLQVSGTKRAAVTTNGACEHCTWEHCILKSDSHIHIEEYPKVQQLDLSN